MRSGIGLVGNIVWLSGAIVLLAGMFLLHIAADKAVFLAECERGLPGEMQSMEDVDIAARARELTDEGNLDAALAVLRYGIEAGIGDPKETGSLLASYETAKEERDTLWEKIKSGGKRSPKNCDFS